MELEPKSKFEFIAEILPLNERTKEIMAIREQQEKQRQMEAEEVLVSPNFLDENSARASR